MIVLLNYYYRKDYELLQNSILENRDREEDRRAEYTQSRLSEITGTMLFMKEAQDKDDALKSIVIEKVVHDYTQTALAYFSEAEYLRAYEEFTRVLRYRRTDTTILFYQTYSLYVHAMANTLDGLTGNVLLEGIAAIEKRGFKSSELLGYSEGEMRQKLTDMAFNINERLAEEGAERWQ
jgi:hypothetical protein